MSEQKMSQNFQKKIADFSSPWQRERVTLELILWNQIKTKINNFNYKLHRVENFYWGKPHMNGRFSLLCAAILLAFSGNSRACDRLLSSESIGPISSNVWDCGDYNFFVHRETCLNGEDFVSTWHVNVENLEGVCPLDYSVVKVCNGDCGEGLRLILFFVQFFMS